MDIIASHLAHILVSPHNFEVRPGDGSYELAVSLAKTSEFLLHSLIKVDLYTLTLDSENASRNGQLNGKSQVSRVLKLTFLKVIFTDKIDFITS